MRTYRVYKRDEFSGHYIELACLECEDTSDALIAARSYVNGNRIEVHGPSGRIWSFDGTLPKDDRSS